MSDAFSLGQVPGMVENLHLIKSGLMARHGRPKSRIQTGFGPWWLGVIATGAILMNSGVAAQTPEQIELGRQLFMEETLRRQRPDLRDLPPPKQQFHGRPCLHQDAEGQRPAVPGWSQHARAEVDRSAQPDPKQRLVPGER